MKNTQRAMLKIFEKVFQIIFPTENFIFIFSQLICLPVRSPATAGRRRALPVRLVRHSFSDGGSFAAPIEALAELGRRRIPAQNFLGVAAGEPRSPRFAGEAGLRREAHLPRRRRLFGKNRVDTIFYFYPQILDKHSVFDSIIVLLRKRPC